MPYVQYYDADTVKDVPLDKLANHAYLMKKKTGRIPIPGFREEVRNRMDKFIFSGVIEEDGVYTFLNYTGFMNKITFGLFHGREVEECAYAIIKVDKKAEDLE